MALSVKAKKVLTAALANKAVGVEIAAAIDASGSGPAAVVTAFGTTTAVPLAALSTSNTYSDSAVNAAINASVAGVETRLDNLEAKINAILVALKNAGLMSVS